MKNNHSSIIEKGRMIYGPYGTKEQYGRNGAFQLLRRGIIYRFVVSDQDGWEHVSVTLADKRGILIKRTPTWDEMCFVKDVFWNPDEVVMQLHPAESDYVNCHAYCLHLWKPTHLEIPRPPKDFV